MSGTPFSTGQLGKLRTHIDVGVATALPKVVEKFPDPKRVLKAFDGRGEMFAGRMEEALEQAIKSMLVLIPREPVSLTITSDIFPDKFYQTRSGLYVYNDYRERIVAKAKPVEAGATFKVNVDELGEDLTDEQIELALGKNHLFGETAVSAIIAEMISKQPNGEPGDLENTGYANLLYAPSWVALVYWSSDSSEWYVDTFTRGDYGWFRGGRVLSPAN